MSRGIVPVLAAFVALAFAAPVASAWGGDLYGLVQDGLAAQGLHAPDLPAPAGEALDAAPDPLTLVVWSDAPPREDEPAQEPQEEPSRGSRQESLAGTTLAFVPFVGAGPAPLVDLAFLDDAARVLPPLLADAQAPAAAGAAPAPAAEPVRAASVDAPAPAPSSLGPAQAAVVAAAAAASAAAPGLGLTWERLRRALLLSFLYTRIAKERLLDHESRERLLSAVREHTGMSVADLAKATGVPRNTVTYHLRVLEREGLVKSRRAGRHRLFHAPGAMPRSDADALAALRHDTTRRLAREIGAAPGLDQRSLCERVGLAPSLAHWHADRLVTAGIVEKRREGRRVRYYPGSSFGLVASVLR